MCVPLLSRIALYLGVVVDGIPEVARADLRDEHIVDVTNLNGPRGGRTRAARRLLNRQCIERL